MSDFLTLAQVSGGLNGTAPRIFAASTNDDLAAVTTAGYVSNEITSGRMSVLDLLFLTYDVDGTPDMAMFEVTATSGGSLISFTGGGGQPVNANLTALSGLTGAADTGFYFTGAGAMATAALPAYGRTLIANTTALLALDDLGIKRGTTAAYGGGGTSNAFVATGVAATDIVVASLLASANAASLTTVVPTADTLTVDFSADPGAGTIVNWIAIATV